MLRLLGIIWTVYVFYNQKYCETWFYPALRLVVATNLRALLALSTEVSYSNAMDADEFSQVDSMAPLAKH